MINLKIRYNLWKAQRALNPDREFKAVLFKKLDIIWDDTYNVKHVWYHTAWFKHAAGFAVVVLIAGNLGTGVYAYTNPEVTAGSVLFPIKEGLENIEEKIQITPEAKAKFYLKKIERREMERAAIQKNDLKDLPVEVKKEIEKGNKDIKNTEDPKDSENIVKEVQDFRIKKEENLKMRIEVAKRKIQKTEKAIEKTEEQLEKTREIMEKNNSKNIKLREELKKRLEQRLEKRKNDLEVETEQQKDIKEVLRETRQNESND